MVVVYPSKQNKFYLKSFFSNNVYLGRYSILCFYFLFFSNGITWCWPVHVIWRKFARLKKQAVAVCHSKFPRDTEKLQSTNEHSLAEDIIESRRTFSRPWKIQFSRSNDLTSNFPLRENFFPLHVDRISFLTRAWYPFGDSQCVLRSNC